MATTAGDQQRLKMLAAALFASALTIVALRTVKAGREVAAIALPVTDLQSLSPFLGPLRGSSGLARNATNAIAVARDPFAPTRVARSENPARTTADAHVSIAPLGEPWIVSTILVDGSKKSAIVNDAWVTIGDTLGGGSHLTAVERDHIVVTDAKGVRHKVPIQGGESW
jgi:hypothetical protein